MNDTELFLHRHIKYRHIKVDGTAAGIIAFDLGLSPDSVRGRLSRADTPFNRALAAQAAIENPSHGNPPAITRLNDRVDKDKKTFENKQAELVTAGKEVAAMFISDVHLPYVRWDALNLALQIIEDVKPVYISGMNDFLDNEGNGRWPDERLGFESIFGQDIDNVRASEKLIYGAMRKAGAVRDVEPYFLGVNGNHDLWFRSKLRSSLPLAAMSMWADYMDWLSNECKVLVLDHENENTVRLSPGLIWWHGQFISKNHTANGENTIRQFEEEGQLSSVTVGHTHRIFQAKILGRNFYSNGCLSRIEKVPYMKRDPKGWQLSVTVNKYQPGTRYEHGDVIPFSEEGTRLIARYGGHTYEAPLMKG